MEVVTKVVSSMKKMTKVVMKVVSSIQIDMKRLPKITLQNMLLRLKTFGIKLKKMLKNLVVHTHPYL